MIYLVTLARGLSGYATHQYFTVIEPLAADIGLDRMVEIWDKVHSVNDQHVGTGAEHLCVLQCPHE